MFPQTSECKIYFFTLETKTHLLQEFFSLSHLHAALHARGSSVVQTGAVMVVGGVDVGPLVLAPLQSGPGPAQDHLTPQRTHKPLASVTF